MKQYILLALAGITGLLCFRGPAETGPETNSMRQIVRLSEHAMALYLRGKLDGAKVNFTAVRMELSQSVGPRDPATLSSRSNYAAVLFAMGDYAGAEAVHRETIKLRDQVFGRLHMDAVASRHNLAVTLMCEGKYEEALRNERCVESVRRHLLGKMIRSLGRRGGCEC